MSDEVLFKSAADALRFAFNYSHQQYDRPLMNRLAGSQSEGKGKGLSGLDGAAQAGMIRRELSTLSTLYRAVLVAQHAPRTFVCDCGRSCCAGTRINFEWRDAVSTVASYACRLVPGGRGRYLLRRDLVFRLYGSGATLVSIAKKRGVSEQTASEHNSRVSIWLRRGQEARGGRKAVLSIEDLAGAAAHRVLTQAGMVGLDT